MLLLVAVRLCMDCQKFLLLSYRDLSSHKIVYHHYDMKTFVPQHIEKMLSDLLLLARSMLATLILRQEYASKERVWASYGDYDRRVFERQCREFQVEYPFGVRHLNIKTLFALVHALPFEPELAEALGIMKLPLEGTHHRGGDDAW